MKLALVIGSLEGGGAERVMSVLASAWAQRGEDVTLITIDDASGDKYKLDPRVERVSLGLERASRRWWQGLTNNLQRVRTLRATLRSLDPDRVLSFLTSTNILSILAAWRLEVPVVVSERVASNHEIPVVWRLLRALIYRYATAVVVQTQRGLAEFKGQVPRKLIHVIPNPVRVDLGGDTDAVAVRVTEDCRNCNILVAVGRLAQQKGFDLLLHAFATIAANHMDWCLVILGEGPERGRLQELARALGIADRVSLPGFTRTPHALLRRAQLFVLSSRYEGFPNALLEAMACGLPCVSFDCPTGPAELIGHQISGLLAQPENTEALAAALARLMDSPELRERYGRAAKARVEEYLISAVLARWDTVFGTCSIIEARAVHQP